MKFLSFSRQALPGVLALACVAAVVLATAFDAAARLGPAGPATTTSQAPAAAVPAPLPSQ